MARKSERKMKSRFDYVKFDAKHTELMENAKSLCSRLEGFIDGIKHESRNNHNYRPISLAHTKLEETYAWIGKAIRDRQIALSGDSSHMPERDNS